MAWHTSTPYYANQSGHKYAQGYMYTERSNTNGVGFFKNWNDVKGGPMSWAMLIAEYIGDVYLFVFTSKELIN